MESPINIVKSNLSVSKILGGLVVLVAIFAVFDLTGLTNWVLYPVTTARSKFSKASA